MRRGRIQIWLLLAVLLSSAVARAQLTFITNNGAITITGYIGNPTIVKIPSTTNGYPVTSIADNAFLGLFTLTSITIPNSVTNLGSFAFDQCSGLTNFTFGNAVTTIGTGAFIQCLGLTNITIPDSVTTIGSQAFSSCRSLTSIKIPNSVTNLGDRAFNSCIGLTNIIMGRGISTIGQYPLAGCTHLITATVGIPNIGMYLFYSTSNPNNPFPNLTSITLLDTVTNIAPLAFITCGSLTNVIVGSGVTTIGTGAFQGLTALKALTVATNNSSFSSLGGVLFDVNQSTLIQFPCGLEGSYLVPNSVTNIGSGAFAFCIFLTKIYFAGNAPSLGSSPFTYDLATIYYLPGTTGWSATYGGLATALWLPQTQTTDASFGVQNGQFGFNINWASGQTVVVEASTNLTNPIWSPVATNTLTSNTAYYSDPQWTNYPGRFYRLRSP